MGFCFWNSQVWSQASVASSGRRTLITPKGVVERASGRRTLKIPIWCCQSPKLIWSCWWPLEWRTLTTLAKCCFKGLRARALKAFARCCQISFRAERIQNPRRVLLKGLWTAHAQNPRKVLLEGPIMYFTLQIPIRYAHAADPGDSPRASSIRQLIKRRHFVDPTLSRYPGWVPTPNPTPRDPPPPHPHPPTPTHPPKGPRGGQGTQGRLRRPWGEWGPWDPLGSFRSYSEWKAISNGRRFRVDGRLPSGRPA